MTLSIDTNTEWLECDGLGGFASGTTCGVRTRRYHALLLAANSPPTGRFVLINGADARVVTPAGEFEISAQCYSPGITTRSDRVRIESFTASPWPRWVYLLADGTRIAHEVLVRHGSPTTVMTWKIEGGAKANLRIRPLLSGRDYHALHHENPGLQFDGAVDAGSVRWTPYPGVPRVTVHHNGQYSHQPVWYRAFEYAAERERGFPCTEDLASPGVFSFDLAASEAAMILSADTPGQTAAPEGKPLIGFVERLRKEESDRRRSLGGPLESAADAYIVRRDKGRTILAGYPWFADWGRDTFISIRGLCIATGRLDEARDILIRWAAAVSEGMMPNRFPDKADESPEYNSVDASLWFIVAVHELLGRAASLGKAIAPEHAKVLSDAVQAVVLGYAKGTRYRIKMDDDALLAAGEPGVQLTWMDARVGERVITPRIGKPVEIQALWINALWIACQLGGAWESQKDRAMQSFKTKFWNAAGNCLFDVVDCDHVRGANDATFRPNQIFAVGGLPLAVIEGERARQVVAGVESRLLTPLGLRSLAPGEPGYTPCYQGGPEQRDGAYHQGTVWPWLLGPFVEAWLRVQVDRSTAQREARQRFLAPIMRHLGEAGIGHVSEIADAQPPHRPRGCPFQAWSLGELIRLDKVVLTGDSSGHGAPEVRRDPQPLGRRDKRARA